VESKLIPNSPTKSEPTKEQPKPTEKKVEPQDIKQLHSPQPIKTESPIIDKAKQEPFKSIASHQTEQKPILAHENNKVEPKPVTISPTAQLLEQKNLTETKPELDTKPDEQVITLSEGEQKNNSINESKKSKKKRSAALKTEESSAQKQALLQESIVMNTEETESTNLPETSTSLDPLLQKQPPIQKDTKKKSKRQKNDVVRVSKFPINSQAFIISGILLIVFIFIVLWRFLPELNVIQSK